MKKRILFIGFILAFFCSGVATAQKYAVHFKDKNGTPYSVNNPSAFLSQRAIERREKFHIAITEDDLPVNPDYVSQVKNAGATILFSSKWINCVLIQSNADVANQIAALGCVDKVVCVKPASKSEGSFSGKFADPLPEKHFTQTSTNRAESVYGEAYNQIAQLNGIAVHEKGYQGEGILIAVLDSGFDKVDVISSFSQLFAENRILMVKDFVKPGDNVYLNTHNHGTNVLSCMAAYWPNRIIGTAPEASYCLFRTEDAATEYLIEEYNWACGAEAADSVGADIINTSLSYHAFDDPSTSRPFSEMDGKTAIASIAAQKAIDRGVFVCVSAGNTGDDNNWPWIGTPADVNDALTVGAVYDDGDYVDFSSIGPNAAGEQKPNTMAQGAYCAVVNTSGNVSYSSGTSFSSPITCGMTACLIQAKPSLKPKDLKKYIEESCDQYGNPTPQMGYGIPDFDAALETILAIPEPEITNNYYAVYFSDKNGTPYTLDEPAAFLSQKALDRRQKFGIELTEDDLPVNPNYIQQLENMGATVLFSSKWINCALAIIPHDLILDEMLTLDCVTKAVYVKPGNATPTKDVKNDLNLTKIDPEKNPAASIYGYAEVQISQLNGIPLHENGYQGEGILIAILDTGFPRVDQITAFDPLFEENRVVMTREFVNKGGNVYEETIGDHGTGVLSCMAAYLPNEMIGTAPKASFCLFRTEDAETEYLIEEYNLAFGAELADSIGADLANASLGYYFFDDLNMNHTFEEMDGNTAVSSIAVQKAVERGVFFCISEGNNGNNPIWPWVCTPGDAGKALSVGAVDKSGNYVSFSSIGPNAAGEQKPNTMARGEKCPMILDNTGVYFASGTSLSSPITCGLAACLMQMYPEKNPADLKKMIEQSANQYENPTTEMGYGIPDFAKIAGLTAIQEIDNHFIKIYPNPTSGIVRFSSENIFTEATIFDLAGRCILKKAVSNSSIDVSELHNGLYIMRLNQKNGSSSNIRIVKQ